MTVFIKEKQHTHREDEPAYTVYGARRTEDGYTQLLIWRMDRWEWVNGEEFAPWRRKYDPYELPYR